VVGLDLLLVRSLLSLLLGLSCLPIAFAAIGSIPPNLECTWTIENYYGSSDPVMFYLKDFDVGSASGDSIVFVSCMPRPLFHSLMRAFSYLQN